MEIKENIVPLLIPPSKIHAEKIIKNLINEGKMSWTVHAKKRMQERDISIQEVRNCLMRGKVIDEPYASTSWDGWETAVERVFGSEALKIGICLSFSQKLVVITTIKFK